MDEVLRARLLDVWAEMCAVKDHNCAAENVREPQLMCDVVAGHYADGRRHFRKAYFLLEGVLYCERAAAGTTRKTAGSTDGNGGDDA